MSKVQRVMVKWLAPVRTPFPVRKGGVLDGKSLGAGTHCSLLPHSGFQEYGLVARNREVGVQAQDAGTPWKTLPAPVSLENVQLMNCSTMHAVEPMCSRKGW